MASMDYCLFENTASDLRRCIEKLDNGEPLSKTEYAAAIRLLKMADDLSAFDPNEIAEPADND